MNETGKRIVLRRRHDHLTASVDGAEPKPARLVWARPISRRGAEIAVVGEDKRELALLHGLDALDPESRAAALEEIHARYLLPAIVRVVRTRVHFGSRYWDVETDRGARSFLIRDPQKNVLWVTADCLVLRDVLGNRYEIPSVARLDPRSRAEMDRVL